MNVGECYVWPSVFRIDPDDGRVTSWLMIFILAPNGGLWPVPVVGVNVSKMPEGEGVPTSYVHRKFAQARRN